MVQIKLSVVFILAAATIAHVIALPLPVHSDSESEGGIRPPTDTDRMENKSFLRQNPDPSHVAATVDPKL